MAFRVLCTGDIHIGRRASKVSNTYRSADAWSSIVALAIDERVDLLALGGDVVDKESRSYEALGPLESGLRRLNEAEIETVAVGGNHDFDVLAKLSGVTGTERFRLLGRGGTWERHTCTGADGSTLHVDGWSFPSEHVTHNPMAAYAPPAADGAPVLGLLHGDVGVVGSRYAPLHLNELWAHPVDLWLLGHIHTPILYSSPLGASALYPGSPLAMDPGEKGCHGVWFAEFAPGQAVGLERRAMSPVRYDVADVDLTGITAETEFMTLLTQALRNLGERAISEHGQGTLEVVSCRLNFTGRSPAHHLVPMWASKANQDIEPIHIGSVAVEIDELTSVVRPEIGLERYALHNDPAGETARLILALEASSPELNYSSLVKDTQDQLLSVFRHNGYATLAVLDTQEHLEGPTEIDAQTLLSSQAWKLLSALVAQKESA